MTQREVREGSVVDLVARIARERSRDATDPREPVDEVVRATEEQPRRLFPGAPRRRARTP
ncbi:MAG TPA: hypothetical protein VFH74_00720 [Gaiellales bacterium]|nr:hypothetical protein [Gaiellales bacterium]